MAPSHFENEQLMAVVSHSLLNSMAVVKGNLHTIVRNRERLTDEQLDQLLTTALSQSDFVCDCLLDFARGLPLEINAILTNGRAQGQAV